MASASPTHGRNVREQHDRSGEAFERFDGGNETLADAISDGRVPWHAVGWKRRDGRGMPRHSLDGAHGR